ncbi:uncharacterized protein PpBr36_09420 [Pyricularia pennisetigena]|uniref:uncharacterized protein n=1 Tax=Pyricularia pennisetigena TaxID=1578925 RepID=UPI00114E33B8|nr:uncharacterized protein PpBr36_09420 [Pyricularia pennisetigena]TLS21940.1 hypothetical protein PpBr36_09420 [Pyricularia pennisetigena]
MSIFSYAVSGFMDFRVGRTVLPQNSTRRLNVTLTYIFMWQYRATVVGCIRLWLLISPYPDPVEGVDWSFSVIVAAVEVNIAICTACLLTSDRSDANSSHVPFPRLG